MADSNTLDLSTTDYERPTVRIDGAAYQMRHPEELHLRDYGRRASVMNRLLELEKGLTAETLDETIDEMDALKQVLVQLLLVDVPDEVIAKLTPGHVRRINLFFSTLLDEKASTGSENGSGSSDGASDSTESPEAD